MLCFLQMRYEFFRHVLLRFNSVSYRRAAKTAKGIYFWISSRLVGESLVNFQCKVAQIVEPIGFTFDDFYFVVDPFKLSVVNGVVTVV